MYYTPITFHNVNTYDNMIQAMLISSSHSVDLSNAWGNHRLVFRTHRASATRSFLDKVIVLVIQTRVVVVILVGKRCEAM